jgi:hypothetical protein
VRALLVYACSRAMPAKDRDVRDQGKPGSRAGRLRLRRYARVCAGMYRGAGWLRRVEGGRSMTAARET